MAYVNVAEWKPEQVTEWLKGLDIAVLPYNQSFLNNEVSGQQLLNIRPDDLDHLGVHKLGHQEIILEAVEHLRNFHYELDRENLQLLALRLACCAQSLHNELSHTTESLVTTQTLTDVANIITAVKPLVRWLDGSPFSGQLDYQDRKRELLKLSLEIATVAHRDRFAERPVQEIRSCSCQLAKLADSIIQDIVDPLILQPASLDLATLKKRAGDDLGISIVPSFHGVHQIAEIKYSSPAHSCGKIEEGDEVVQVNYQTVVGWQTKQVMALFEECQTDVFLTLKKRPRHTKVYGQIYMKPYRLPSKKRAAPYTRWHDNLPSPRPELLTIPDFEMPLPRSAPTTAAAAAASQPPPTAPAALLLDHAAHSESSDEDDDSFLSSAVGAGPGGASPASMRLYLPKPRVTVQRRATVTGASPTNKRPPVNILQFWQDLRTERQWKECSEGGGGADGINSELSQLRGKSASFGNGFNETPPRPSTCLGIEESCSSTTVKLTKNQRAIIQNNKEQNNKKQIKPMENIIESSPVKINNNDKTLQEKSSMFDNIERLHNGLQKDAADGVKKTPKQLFFERNVSVSEPKVMNNVDVGRLDQAVKSFGIARSLFEQQEKVLGHCDADHNLFKLQEKCLIDKELVDSCDSNLDKTGISNNWERCGSDWNDSGSEKGVCTKERGRLDKSHSTPAYDTSESETVENSPVEKTFPPKPKPKPKKKSNATKSSEANVDSNKLDNLEDEAATVDDPDTQKIGQILETINTALLQHRLREQETNVTVCIETTSHRNNALPSEENNTEPKINTLLDTISTLPDYQEISQDDNVLDFSKASQRSFSTPLGSPKELENVKICATPPEPPPRPALILDQSKASISNSDLPKPSVSSPDQSKSSVVNFDQPKVIVMTTDQSKSSGVGYRAMLVAKSLSRSGTNKQNIIGSASLPSPKSLRKKNALLAKRRNVSVAELGTPDVEGWLFHRRRSPGGASGATWHKCWFVLRGTAFYGFNARKSNRAHLMIALPGFTASLAQEVKSRKHAFKVYHTGTVFYFAVETEEELNVWLSSVMNATIRQEFTASDTVLFSESDEGSDSETVQPSPKARKFGGFLSGHSSSQPTSPESKSSEIQKKFGSLKKLGRKQESSLPSPTELPGPAASSLDRKYLRIFGSSRNNVPVPTARFRSYRRVPNTPLHQNKVTGDIYEGPDVTAEVRQFYPSAESVFHDSKSPEPVVKSSTFHDCEDLHRPPSYERVIQEAASYAPRTQRPDVEPRPKKDDKSSSSSCFRGSSTVARKSSSAAKQDKTQVRARNADRQIHASNPSLLIPNEMADYRLAAERLREFGIRRNRQREDTSGFVTLEEFMLSRQEEERRQRGLVAGPGGTTPVARKGSFNSSTKIRREDQREYRGGSPEKFWIDSLRRNDASRRPILLKNAQSSDVNSNQSRLKNAAQYQPPPIKTTNGSTGDETPKMKLAFEMHLDRNTNPEAANSKSSKFRNLFSSKTPQKQLLLETQSTPGSHQKTLLGSPRLHRAIFRDKKSKNTSDSNSSSSLSSPASPPFDWPTEIFPNQSDLSNTQTKPTMGISMIGKKPSRRAVPPSPSPSQSSPPPDYPGLEYPPVFEPETYTLTDASSLLRSRKPTSS